MWPARFNDGVRGVTHTVTAGIADGALRIADPHGTLLASWPLGRVRLAPELDPDGVLAITSRDQPGVLSVDNPAALEGLRAAGLRPPARQDWHWRRWAAVGVGFASVMALAVMAIIVLPGWIAPLIPMSWEQSLGDQATKLVTLSSPACNGQAGQAALDRFVARLRKTGEIAIPVRISVADDELVNAFTFPGGRIIVMRGLIDQASDGAELAGVIGHELGHVVHRDSTTLMLRRIGIAMVMHMIGLGGSPGVIADGASDLASLAYGRAAEAAADDTSIALLTAAGLRADGLSRFFSHMEQTHEHNGANAPSGAGKDSEQEGGMGRRFSWLMSHPPTEDRRKHNERPATGTEPFSPAEWSAIRAMCGGKPADKN